MAIVPPQPPIADGIEAGTGEFGPPGKAGASPNHYFEGRAPAGLEIAGKIAGWIAD